MLYLTPSAYLRNKDIISPVSIVVAVVVNENGNVMAQPLSAQERNQV
jgi:hypothetical protein